MEKMYSEFTNQFEKMGKRMDAVEQERASDRKLTELIATQVSELATQVSNVTKIVTKMEHDHGQKLSVFFDGYVQNTSKLDRNKY